MGRPIPENYIIDLRTENISSNPILSVLPEAKNNGKNKTDEIRSDEMTTQVAEVEKKQEKESPTNVTADQSARHDTKPSHRYDYNTVLETIKSNIDYDDILEERTVDGNMLDEITHVVTATICTDFKDGYVSMGNESVRAEIVRSVFFKLDKVEVENYAACFLRQTGPITKTAAYIRTALFRNHRTSNHYITNRVNVDMPWMAEPKVAKMSVDYKRLE